MLDFSEKTVSENLEIDMFDLDNELKNQSSIYFMYASMLADADFEARRCKEVIELAEAEADNRARNNAPGKVTEALIKTMVAQDDEVLEAHRVYLDALNRRNKIEAAVKAFEQRKSCLDNLVRLHTTQYFAEPQGQIYAKAAEQNIRSENIKSIVRTRLNRRENQ